MKMVILKAPNLTIFDQKYLVFVPHQSEVFDSTKIEKQKSLVWKNINARKVGHTMGTGISHSYEVT